jgi:hypothetical protein
VSVKIGNEVRELRAQVLAEGRHPRTPEIIANLAVGLRYVLAFALGAGAIDQAARDALWQRGWAALNQAAATQARYQEEADPAGQFLRLLAGALASGRGHLVNCDGDEPTAGTQRRWGWRRDTAGNWQPQAAFAEAQRLAVEQGTTIPVSPVSLWKRLKERKLLAMWDAKRQRHTIRQTLEGVKREVLHLRSAVIFKKPSTPSTPSTDSPKTPENGDGSGGRSEPQPSTRTAKGPRKRHPVDGVDGVDGRIRGMRKVLRENLSLDQKRPLRANVNPVRTTWASWTKTRKWVRIRRASNRYAHPPPCCGPSCVAPRTARPRCYASVQGGAGRCPDRRGPGTSCARWAVLARRATRAPV